jgi:hypothetical protein
MHGDWDVRTVYRLHVHTMVDRPLFDVAQDGRIGPEHLVLLELGAEEVPTHPIATTTMTPCCRRAARRARTHRGWLRSAARLLGRLSVAALVLSSLSSSASIRS